jgi:hypothetical protein
MPWVFFGLRQILHFRTKKKQAVQAARRQPLSSPSAASSGVDTAARGPGPRHWRAVAPAPPRRAAPPQGAVTANSGVETAGRGLGPAPPRRLRRPAPSRSLRRLMALCRRRGGRGRSRHRRPQLGAGGDRGRYSRMPRRRNFLVAAVCFREKERRERG